MRAGATDAGGCNWCERATDACGRNWCVRTQPMRADATDVCGRCECNWCGCGRNRCRLHPMQTAGPYKTWLNLAILHEQFPTQMQCNFHMYSLELALNNLISTDECQYLTGVILCISLFCKLQQLLSVILNFKLQTQETKICFVYLLLQFVTIGYRAVYIMTSISHLHVNKPRNVETKNKQRDWRLHETAPHNNRETPQGYVSHTTKQPHFSSLNEIFFGFNTG